MVLVDEEQLIGFGVADELEPASFRNLAPRRPGRFDVAPMGAEPLFLNLAARYPELASLLRGIGRGFLEEGDVVAKAEADTGFWRARRTL